ADDPPKDPKKPKPPADSPPEDLPAEKAPSTPADTRPSISQDAPVKKKPPRRPSGRRPDEIQGLAVRRMNYHRSVARLAAVTWDAYLSDAWRAHAKYLVQNRVSPDSGRGLMFENPESLGFSKEGDEAAKVSLIVGAPGRVMGGESNNIIDVWMASFYHRIPLLRPDLKTLGYGYFSGGGRELWSI